MTEADRDRFDILMGYAYNTHPGTVPNVDTNNIYFELLSEYSIENIERAFREVLRTLEFFPKPGNISKILDSGIEDQIDFAFEETKKMINTCGFHSSIIMTNQVAMQVVYDFGGLQRFSEKLKEEPKDTYFEFKRMYKRIKLAVENGYKIECKKLIGYNEQNAHQSAGGGLFKVLTWGDNVIKNKKELTAGISEERLKLINATKSQQTKLPPVQNKIENKFTSIDEVVKFIENSGDGPKKI